MAGTTTRSNSRETSSVNDLIARLTEANGPDGHLDCLIRAFVEGYENIGGGYREWPDGTRERYDYGFSRPYTASIDAALTLLPEGYETGVHECDGEIIKYPCVFSIVQWQDCFSAKVCYEPKPRWNLDQQELGEAEAATAPLAICVAALEARKYIGGDT